MAQVLLSTNPKPTEERDIFHSFPSPLVDLKLVDSSTLLLTFNDDISSSVPTLRKLMETFGPIISLTSTAYTAQIIFASPSITSFAYNSIKNELNIISMIDTFENDSTSSEKSEEEKARRKLKEIISKNEYREYTPRQSAYVFQTNSLRDYRLKYVARYVIQIENDKEFQVKMKLIGSNGINLRRIIADNCIRFNDFSTKIRLRGKGSGYREGATNEESDDPLELCISTLDYGSYMRCGLQIEMLLRFIYNQFYVFEFLRNAKRNEKKFVEMKKIVKYQYIVNRMNEED